ncbi:MAG TPA: N-acetylmuramoyl-L-alanine amidase, partial [Longimicrobiaceae bacterium]|nr:N-acetylmuramoyl-L-alanine amidase [Longimicrobiaceae bacterium]
MNRRCLLPAGGLVLLAAACAPARPPAAPAVPAPAPAPAAAPGQPEAPRGGGLPEIPERRGSLALAVVYPPEGAELTASDSNFIFGSVGTGGATLRINGAPVEVAPNGAFLAFLPVPGNGVYDLAATGAGEAATLRRTVRVPQRPAAPAREGPLAIVPGSVSPRGAVTVMEGERVEVRVRATPGAQARVVFPDGGSAPLVERAAVERDQGFQQDVAVRPRPFGEYAGSFAARTPLVATDAGVGRPTLVPRPAGGRAAVIELARGTETLRVPLELSLGVLRPGEERVGTAASDRADGILFGTVVPGAGNPYHWFFPSGTRFSVTGERDGAYRVGLAQGLSAWVDARGLRLEPPGAVGARGPVGTVRVVPGARFTDVRLVMGDPLPFRVEAADSALTVTVYGGSGRTGWMYYGAADDLVRRVEWGQPADDRYVARIELGRPLWGWAAFREADGTLVLRVRRPPSVDPARPLAGLLVAVDAGHPPGGASGPTGLREADANLAIARRLVRLLREAGAEVLETRPDSAAVALADRPLSATRANAHLLVSVHNNAFPDGVNPFANHGTTVFYFHPQSLGLARSIQHELVRELGLRDLGAAWADLALARPTWMPAVLSETMFMMLPQQEAALRDPAVQERIARAHLRGIEAFVRERAAR